MRSARFFTSAVQMYKLLRVVGPGTSQSSTVLALKERCSFDQRSWRSTLAEGVDEHSSSPSKADIMMNSVQRYIHQFGRVSRKQLDPLVSFLDKEGSISVNNSVTLLQWYGHTLFDETPSTRLKLADELWNMFKKHGIPLNVTHYNTLLAVYNTNKLKFSPTDFLANMEAAGMSPNRVTYQRLIARFCEEGDIQGATQVLEHMKSKSMPINDNVFNSFITGHLRSNDPENAKNIVEIMKQTGLEPTSMTYTALAVGFAERGEVEEVKKFISQAEIENVTLHPGQLLDIYATFAVSGHSEHLKEVYPFLHNGMPFNQDAVRVCNQLIADGQEDAAYQLFLEIPKPSRADTDQMTLGRFFLRALARNERPVDKVVQVVEDMQRRQINKDDLSSVAHLAYLEKQPEYALSVLKKMKTEKYSVRSHYFWPAICQFRDTSHKEGIYEAMEQLIHLCESQDDLVHTLHMYTIPALLKFGESWADITTRLQKFGADAKDVHFAFVIYLMEKNKLEEAIAFLDNHEVFVFMATLRTCVLSMIGKDVDWQLIMQILGKLKSQSSDWRGPSLVTTALVLKQIMLNQRKADWADIHSVFDFMVQNDLKILVNSQANIAEYFKGAPFQILKRLDDVTLKRRSAPTPETERNRLSEDLTIQELRHMAEQNPQNKNIQIRLLIKACAIGDQKEAEKVLSGMEAEGFPLPPLVLTQLTYLYATFVKDLDKAQSYLQQLEANFPEHAINQTVILKMAALQTANGNADAAVETLKSFAEKHQSGVQKDVLKKEERIGDILRNAQDMDTAKLLMDTLTLLGYLPANNIVLLDAYMDIVLNSGEADRILQEFEEIVKTHKCSPKVDRLLQFFIKKEDPDGLQKVVDLVTEVHGLTKVLHHLIAEFIECGHVSKAKKIVKTPGLRANMKKLNDLCQSFIERNMIKELEVLVEITRNMFAVDRDNMLFHLIRGYVKQGDLDKAKNVLLQFEEELLQPSVRTLRFLARSLQYVGQEVPFDIPQFQPIPRREERPATKGSKAFFLKEKIEKGEVEQVLADLQGANKSLLHDALTMMKKPWPIAALSSVFQHLSQRGDMDTLLTIKMGILPNVLQNSVRAKLFSVAVNSGRAEEVIERMEKDSIMSAKYLTLPALDALHRTSPQLFNRVESMAKSMYTEKNYREPLSTIWCYYRYHENSSADQLFKEFPGFDKTVLISSLYRAAINDNKVDMLESVLKLKQDLGQKEDIARAYSALLELYASQDDVESLEKTCKRITGDGFLPSNLPWKVAQKAQVLLKKNNRPLPAWVDDTSSSDSSSCDEDRK